MSGKDVREKRIIEVLSGVYGLTLSGLSRELRLRESTLRLLLKRMEKKGIVVLEWDAEGREFVRLTGYKKEKGESSDPMFG